MSNNVDSILARSNELLMRVRRQIEQRPSYEYEYLHPPSHPVAVPFAPTAISLDETAHSIQTAGDQPPEADETGRPSTNDDEAQRRLREFFAQRMSALNSRASISQPSISELPPAPPPDENPPSDGDEEPHEEEEEDKNIIKDLKPYLDEPYVITDKKTTTLVPEIPVLSTADILHPIQYDEDIDNVNFIEQNIAEDGLWVPDLPLCKPENVRRIEYRLLWDDPERQKYFGAGLALKIDTPPICQIAPPFPIEPLDHYGRGIVSFAPASVWGLEDIDIKREFKIEVAEVQFLIHPLSCPEDIVTKKIIQLYKAYLKDQNFSRVEYYKQRIAALREAWKKAARAKDVDQEKKFLDDLHNCREMQEMEENNSRMIREDLVKTLKMLKEIRSNSVTISPITLRWKRRNFTREEKAEQQAKYDRELNHRVKEEMRRIQIEGLEPNEAEIKREILQRADDLGLRKPGESLWKPVLEYNAEVTPLEECPPQEKERRELIGRAQIFLKYYVNRQETHKSPPSQLDANFVAAFSDNKKWVSNIIPHTIKVEIWESGYFKGNRLVASVVLPITIGTLPEFKAFEFTSDLTNNDGQLVMGTISARCYIIPESKGEVFVSCPDGQTKKTKRQLTQDPSTFMSVPDLLQIAEKHDPNDPYMASILSQVAAQRTSDLVDRKKIRLDTLLENSTFASLVPTSIGKQLTQYMERLRQQDEERRRKAQKQEAAKSSDYLSQIKQNEIVQNAKSPDEIELKDVVREAPMPNVPKIIKWIGRLIAMYRPLMPKRLPPETSKLTQTYMKAVIRIMHGFNIPQRTTMAPNTSSSLLFPSVRNQNADVYCKITFKGKEEFTRHVNGTDPIWNEAFEFPLSENEDSRPEKAELAKQSLRIDIYDEYVSDVKIDDREEQTKHEKYEQHIIGYIIISLQALWAKDHIQGTYPVITPPFQLAYSQPEKPTGLVIFGAINPALEDEDISRKFDSAESEEVILRADAWEKKVKEQIKNYKDKRRLLVMVSPPGGNSILPCRMVKKQAPPENFEEKQQLIRFVSMIPNRSDAEVFDTAGSMWCTSQEFLKMNAGDDEEHALLLCNYFKYIGLDAYIILGLDCINGKTTFVATKEGNKITLYDPMSGLSWHYKDRDCTLYSIGMIFNDDNIWANIQDDAKPYSIDWNIHNPKKWRPFFTIDFRKPQFNSPQQDALFYEPSNEAKAKKYERELLNRLKDSVETWREHQQTSWKRDFEEKIQYALELCERAAMTDPNTNFQQVVNDFKINFANYTMNGGPFCLPYTSADEIEAELKTRKTWKTEASRVYFALGVLVVPYPNNLYAVWVMLATLQSTSVSELPL